MRKNLNKIHCCYIEKPNPKQAEFFLAQERFTAYGGARGGGKSWAVRRKALLLATAYPGIRLLLLRRTYPQLRENHILPLLRELNGLADYKESHKAFTFSNGSRLKFGYCDTENDVHQYQGQEYDVIFIDEATQFTEYQFRLISACLRGVNNYPKRFYLTCNPGGVGHAWVKRLFIDRQFKPGEHGEDYRFIPARVYDNQPLLQADQGYLRNLESLPEKQRRAWLDGDWNVFEGQYFSMWQEKTHVVQAFPIPADWPRYFTMDYGRDMLAAYWLAIDGENRACVYKELYRPGLLVSEAAQAILELTNEPLKAWYAPPDLWHKHSNTGRSTADIFAAKGIPLVKADNRRVEGWYQVAEWLKPQADAEGELRPSLTVWSNCHNLIRTLPMLQYDAKNPNDTAREPHELTHAPDALRYFCAEHPFPGAAMQKPAKAGDFGDLTAYDRQLADFLSYGRDV